LKFAAAPFTWLEAARATLQGGSRAHNTEAAFPFLETSRPALLPSVRDGSSYQRFVMSFSEMKLHPSLLRAVQASGYTTPTPIQRDAVPPALEGRDVLGCAMTGSGKTAAFVLPILERLIPKTRGVTRALILTPTRELAAQIEEQITTLGKFTNIKSATVFGGVAFGAQQQAFERGADIIVATPGRLLDHFQYRYAKLASLEVLVLDEADRMLDMGFLPDIRRVLKHIPRPQQTLFFSATMPKEIAELSASLLRDPATFNVERQARPATGVTQALYPVPQTVKNALLLKLLETDEVGSAIVFTRTKHRADRVAKFLAGRGVDAERIHGDRSQTQRTNALSGFKSGKYRVLVATDIAARGIDIHALEHVVNFDVPNIPEDYIHRVGRTARAERTGEALTFVAPEEESLVRDIERAIGNKLPRRKLEGFDYTAEAPKAPSAPPVRVGVQRAPRPSEVRAHKPASSSRPVAAARPSASAKLEGAGAQGDAPKRKRRRRGGRGRGKTAAQTA
jgi:ATP-dependent RNA helicase RhlE